jgi:hypothetical protein
MPPTVRRVSKADTLPRMLRGDKRGDVATGDLTPDVPRLVRLAHGILNSKPAPAAPLNVSRHRSTFPSVPAELA